MIGPADILAGKILIVDDQPVNIELLEQLLNRAGYRSIASTSDPREVCQLHLDNRFDLILLDLQMPGLDGFAVMEELARIESDGYLPVLVVTAQPSHKMRALRGGARDFVSKPFVLAEVLIRVHNMLEVRLLHAQTKLLYDRAQQAIRARDDVLGIVAHDLRSPLNTIVTQLESIRRSGEARDVVASVDQLSQAAQQMERLIRDLLDVARLDAGQGLALDQACVDPQVLLEAAVELTTASARRAGLALEVGATELAGPIWADFARLLQVFDNLIGNAIKFTPAGGTIRVSAAKAGSEVVFSVADTGAGIPGDHIPHLFDRFWQQDQSDRRGAGLGLAIVRGIVEGLGGRIWVESTLGTGTTFHFTVPLAADQGRATRMRLGPPRDKFTILVVDDDDGARMAIHDVLREEGFTVLEARSAAAALELFASRDGGIDLLLTDVRLGATDGVELAEQVRGVRPIPVVFMSGRVDPRLAGGAFVPKPINLASLIELVEHELARSQVSS